MSFVVEQIKSTKPVEELYQIVYPDKDLSKFEWLYMNNPAGPADIFIIKDINNDKTIATYCFIPMNLNLKDSSLLIGQAIDGMVHPEYRKKHIFNQLVAEVFPIVSKKYDFLIGFPNNRSRGSLIRAGWLKLGDLVNFSFPIKTKAFSGILPDNKLLKFIGECFAYLPLFLYKKYYKSRGTYDDAVLSDIPHEQVKIPDIISKIRKINPIGFERTSEFIHWRMQTIPKKNYKQVLYLQDSVVQGFISYKKELSSIEIIDFIINPAKKHISTALSLLIKTAEQEMVDSLHIQLSEFAYPCKYLKEKGFISRSGENAVIIYPTKSSNKTLYWDEIYISLADTDWL